MRLNQKGISHHLLLPLIVILAIGGVGAYIINRSGATGAAFKDVTFGDVNKDGFGDMVGMDTLGVLKYYQSNGTAAPFTSSTSIGSGWQQYSRIWSADMNGDGLADLLAQKPSGEVMSYINTGTAGSYFPKASLVCDSGCSTFRSLTFADVNNDKKADMLALASSGTVRLYPNSGSATIPFAGVTSQVASGWQQYVKIWASDMNGDGFADVQAQKSNGEVVNFMNSTKAGAYFSASNLVCDAGCGSYALLAFADLSKDNRADMAAVNSTGSVKMYANNGTAIPFAGGSKPIAVVAPVVAPKPISVDSTVTSQRTPSVNTPAPSGCQNAVLSQGASGGCVTEMQQKVNGCLASAGSGTRVATDGAFGPMTRNGVIECQRANGIGADGVVGPQTWGVLMRYGSVSSGSNTGGSSQGSNGGGRGAAPSGGGGSYTQSNSGVRPQTQGQTSSGQNPTITPDREGLNRKPAPAPHESIGGKWWRQMKEVYFYSWWPL